MIRYVFKDRPLTIKAAKDADAQEIGERLEMIATAHDGRLKPKDVVADARDKRSPLHKHFEWNDKIAADKYRLDQAREIVRVIQHAPEGNEPAQPAFISVSAADGVAYRRVGEVITSLDLQISVMKQAVRDLEAWTARYGDLAHVCGDVSIVTEELRSRLADIETASRSRQAVVEDRPAV